MKTLLFIFIVLTGLPGFSQVSQDMAKELFKDRFFSLAESKTKIPDLSSNLKINYSEEVLRKDSLSLLLPTYLGNTLEYRLIRIEELLSTAGKETYSLEESKKILLLLSLRSNLSFQKDEFSKSFSCFFRIKEETYLEKGIRFCAALSYGENRFMMIDAPYRVRYGLMNFDSIVFLTENDKGSIVNYQELEEEYLAPETKAQIIKILTISNL